MHMLCNDVLGKVDSGTREVLGFDRPLKLETIARLQIPLDRVKGTVYNLTEWKYGFSTAIYTYGDILRLVNYVQKYMVKGQQQIFGRYFWYSKNMELYPELELRNEWGAFASSFSPVRENSAGMRFKFENHNTLKEE